MGVITAVFSFSEEMLLKEGQKPQLVQKKEQAACCEVRSIAVRNGLILPPGAESGCLLHSGGGPLCKKPIFY